MLFNFTFKDVFSPEECVIWPNPRRVKEVTRRYQCAEYEFVGLKSKICNGERELMKWFSLIRNNMT